MVPVAGVEVASRSSIKVTDKGYKKLLRTVFEFGAPNIAVGVQEADGAKKHNGKGNATVVEVATWQEFGTKYIPARSFLRAYVDENSARLRQMMFVLMQSVIKGSRTKEQAVNILGQKMVGEIQARISARIPPPLAASTIKRKKSDVPLIDTGQLRASITYRVIE